MNTLRENVKLRDKLANLVEVTYYVPCLNEELNIIKTIEKICQISKRLKLTFELLVYNDGSTDRTGALVEEFSTAHPEYFITLVNNKNRRGLGYNYTAGAFKGVGQYYMMVCGDNSETQESMIKILDKRGQADIIIPYFGKLDNRTWSRRGLSFIFTALVNLLGGFRLHYYNGPVLHFRKNVMRWRPTGTGFAYQAELLCVMLEMKKTYIQVQIDNNDRAIGFSRAFHLKNFLSVGHSLLQMFLRSLGRSVWPNDEVSYD